MRIERADDDPRDSRVDHRLRARRGQALMVARLERHVQRRTARFARGLERFRFGVRHPTLPMEALAQGQAVADQRRADGGIRRGAALAALGKLTGAREIDAIDRVDYGLTSTPRQNATRSL